MAIYRYDLRSMDPYRPPQYEGPPSFLFVPRAKRLPRVCLKCASTDEERVRFESREFRQPRKATNAPRRRLRATVELPLCERCSGRLPGVGSTRGLPLYGLLGSLPLAFIGWLNQDTTLVVLGGVAFVGAVVVTLAARLKQRQFPCQRVEDDGVTIGGVAPAALTAIKERLSDKKKKKSHTATAAYRAGVGPYGSA